VTLPLQVFSGFPRHAGNLPVVLGLGRASRAREAEKLDERRFGCLRTGQMTDWPVLRMPQEQEWGRNVQEEEMQHKGHLIVEPFGWKKVSKDLSFFGAGLAATR
jgi:hypothetical protein